MRTAPAELAIRQEKVILRPHTWANLSRFLAWYADPELAHLTRHDQKPLTPSQIRTYFESTVLPTSEAGHCFGIHTVDSDELIGTCALTDFTEDGRFATLRILIGEPIFLGCGYGTSAVRLLANYGFDCLGLHEIVLGVFDFNERAIRSYEKVGFRRSSVVRLTMPPGYPPANEILMVLDATTFQGQKAICPFEL